MTFTEYVLDTIALTIAEFERKDDTYYVKAEDAFDVCAIEKAKLYQGKYIAYRTAAEMLKDNINNATKFIEPLESLKRQIQEYGVKQWLETGIDVLEIGDAYLSNNDFARLETYHKLNALHFCGYFDTITGKCGQIVLNNGRVICYNIHNEPEENNYDR
jgi:hypothetical protein